MRWPARETFRSSAKFLAACGSELLAPVLRQQVRHLPAPSPVERWRKVLLLGANHIGDILYRTAGLRTLAAAMPDCRFHILAPGAAGDVLRYYPSVERVHGFGVEAAQLNLLAGECYDAVICYDTGAYLPSLRLAVRLGIPNRVAYVHKGFSAWVTHPVIIRWPQPFPAYFRDLVSQLTGSGEHASLRPVVAFSEADISDAASALRLHGLESKGQWLACFPFSRQPGSHDAGVKVLEILAALEETAPELTTVLLGAPSEIERLSEVVRAMNLRARVISPCLPVRTLTAFLSHAAAVLCADSGPRHLANAAGRPVFFVRNLASQAIETGVYLDTETDLCPPDLGFLDRAARSPVLAGLDPKEAAAKILRSLM